MLVYTKRLGNVDGITTTKGGGIMFNLISIFRKPADEGSFEREFHSERFQAELQRLRAGNDAYREAMEQIHRTTKEESTLKIAARCLGLKP